MSMHLDEMMALVASLSEEPRFPGTRGAETARVVIQRALEGLGFTVRQHKAGIPRWVLCGSPRVEVIAPSYRMLLGMAAILSPPTPSDGIVGRLSLADSIQMLDSFVWPRISVVNDANVPIGFLMSSERDLRSQPLAESAQGYPHVIIDFDRFSDLSRRIAIGEETRVRLYNPTVFDGQCDLVNLLTQDACQPTQILVCAHYDSIYDSPGALDNASGVAVALKIAESAKIGGWPCQFAFFDGEELNKVGSRSYVQSLTDQQLSRLACVIEIDTVGSGTEIALLCSKKMSRLLRSLPLAESLSEGFDLEVSPQSRIAFSDVWPFMQKGVPAIRTLTRGTREPGQGNDVIHTDRDRFANVDPETVWMAASAIGMLTEHLCRRILSS